MITFFRFIGIPEHLLAEVITLAKSGLHSLGVNGSLLLSTEGVNGQFCIPISLVSEFKTALLNVNDRIFNGIDYNIGDTVEFPSSEVKFPFKKLMVKQKKEILTTRFPDPSMKGKSLMTIDDDDNQIEGEKNGGMVLNWNDCGEEMPPEKWHSELHKKVDSSETADSPILIDCRNYYESDIGTFEGALPLNTTIFSDSWNALENTLSDVPKDRKIMTFCTGGIRCVKVNAYLKQKMGYDNVASLKKGIIAYEKWVSESEREAEDALTLDDTNITTDAVDSAVGTKVVVAVGSNAEGTSKDNTNDIRSSYFVGENFLFDRRRLADQYNEESLDPSYTPITD